MSPRTMRLSSFSAKDLKNAIFPADLFVQRVIGGIHTCFMQPAGLVEGCVDMDAQLKRKEERRTDRCSDCVLLVVGAFPGPTHDKC